MSKIDKEEIEEWNSHVEDVCQKINDLLNDRIKPEEIDPETGMKLDEKKLAKLKAREAKRAKEEQERLEKLKRGRDGGGEKENYADYCRKCKVEYTLPTSVCVRCEKATVPCAERRKELLAKVDEYKEAKLRKQERKRKWELWKKTQAIFWKKTSTNYEKWEYFTDSEDEFEALEKDAKPVLPENDPNFRALAADLEQRSFDRRKRAKEANELKLKANDMMKKRFFDRAAQIYTEAIDLYRNNKYLWTNRALAYLKQGKFQEAVDDCTKMLEYAEVLENGYEQSKDANFKFFARRAMAYMGLKKYDKALTDIENAVKLFPEDKSALETRKEILQKIESEVKLEELETKINDIENLSKNFTPDQLKTKGEIDSWISLTKNLNDDEAKKKLREYDYAKLHKITQDEELKLYFLKAGGLDSFKRVLKDDHFTVTSASDRVNFLPFLRAISEHNHMYGDALVENKFVRNVIKRIMTSLDEMFPNNAEKRDNAEANTEEKPAVPEMKGEDEEPTEPTKEEVEKRIAEELEKKKRRDEMYDYKVLELEEFIELLITFTENRSVRSYLRDRSHLLIPTFKIIYENLMPRVDKEYGVLSSVISFYSNLCMSDVGLKNTEIRDHIIQNYIKFIYSFAGGVLARPQNKYLCLKNSCLAFIVNLSTDKTFRDHCLNLIVTFEGLNKDRKNVLVKPDDFNHVAYFMQNLGIGFNQLYKKTAEGKMKEYQTQVSKFYEHSTGVLLNLFFQLTDKVTVGHMKIHFRRWKLDQVCVEVLHNILKFRLNTGILLNRFVNVVAKLGFDPEANDNSAKMLYILCEIMMLFEEDTTKNTDFFTDSIRFLASTLQEFKDIGKPALELSFLKAKGLNSQIRSILRDETKHTMR
jgi:tetratricopeptide (TPR) repeat protein